MISRTSICLAIATGAIQIAVVGCYYPAKLQPPSQAKDQTVVQVPYDLTWDALHTVVNTNGYKILGDDPNHGIVEAEAHSFTLADADCGQMKSLANRYDAERDAGGSAVYNFKVETAGPEASQVSVSATFSTPLHVPLHPITDFQCVSRGVQEARLLKEIAAAAQAERRPVSSSFGSSNQLAPQQRPSLMGTDVLKRPGESPQ
jgi:hypothetical protein